MSTAKLKHIGWLGLRAAAIALSGLMVLTSANTGASAPPAIPLAQIPLTAAIPAHPQVLFAIGNSESMDGTVSGAIMTGGGAGSGSNAAPAELQTSGSPVNYTIPAGFTPPLVTNADGVTAPNTTSLTVSGTAYEADNSASRLNVAKQGIAQILQTYLPVADFAIEDYSMSSVSQYTTWVYYMSPNSGSFEFTNNLPQPAINTFSLSASTVNFGTNPTLSWNVANNPAGCTAAESPGVTGFSGTVGATGSVPVVPASNPGAGNTATFTFTLVCATSSESTSQSINLTVVHSTSALTPTVTLSLSPSVIPQGASSTLTWTVQGVATSCTATEPAGASGFNGSVSASGGSATLGAFATQGQYGFTLKCSNAAGSATQVITANVGTVAGEEVPNPCYNINTTGPTTVDADCKAIETSSLYSGVNIANLQYMIVGASSDDAVINDVLYAGGGIDPVCLVYGTVSPANPYTAYGLSTYETGGVSVTYGSQINNCARQTTPTNAGFVPFSPQTMYVQRGFGYGGNQSATTGVMVVGSTSTAPKIISAGQTPTSATLTTALAAFGMSPGSNTVTPGKPLAPETNSTGTGDIKASGGQSPLYAMANEAVTYFKANPPTSNSCLAQQYLVLLTDGLPTEDKSGNSFPPVGAQSAAPSPNGYGVSATFNTDGSLSGGNDQPLTDTINILGTLATTNPESITSNGVTTVIQPGVRTYVIGLGAGVQPANNPVAAQALTAMAVAGGTASLAQAITSPSSAYFPATSPATLVADLQAILAQIIGTNQSVSSTAVNSTGLNTSTTLYQASFSTQDTYQDWTGDVQAFPAGTSTSTGTLSASPTWSAQSQLDTLAASGSPGGSTRIIATWQPATSSGIPFEWLGGSATSSTTGIAGGSTLASQLTSTSVTPSSTDSNGQDRLNYLRGSTAQEQRNGGAFRNRTHILGDIVDSNPLYVGPSPSNESRSPVLYVGANDGMLHAFDAGTGKELFAYIPNGVFANLPKLTSPFYNALHQFFVDGSPQSGDVTFGDGSMHTIVVSGENAGGQTIFALDVTKPATLTTETTLAAAALWEFSDANMGYSFSQPVVAQISSSGSSAAYAVIFGNGYDSPSGQPYLYAVNPQTGATLAKINLCGAVATACSGSTANGLSSVAVINNSGLFASAATTVYAGDLQGNMWRVDISDPNPANWASHVTVLFQATDDSGTPGAAQPITQAPQVTLNPQFPHLTGTMVLFGTGELLSVSDLGNTQDQTMYGVFDDTGTATAATMPYTRTKLKKQTLSLSSSGSNTTIVVSGTTVTLSSTVKGWFADLDGVQAGLRDVTAPVLENGGALVTTLYAPNSNECVGGGTGYLLVQNFANGQDFATPQFELPGNTSLSQTPKYTVGIELTGGFGAAPTVVETTASGNTAQGQKKFISEANRTTQMFFENLPGQFRTGWWEIQ